MAAAMTLDEAAKPFMILHVLGSCGSGKRTFKRKWFESLHARVLPEIADLHLKLHKNCDSSIVDGLDKQDLTNHFYLFLYRADSQGSIEFAHKGLELLYTSIPEGPVDITVVENHFEKTFKPQLEVVTELPPSFNLPFTHGRPLPLFWHINLLEGVQISAILDQTIVSPLLHLMGEETKAKVIASACRQGRLSVLKLLAPRLEDSDPVSWLPLVIESLEAVEQQGATPTTSGHGTTPTTVGQGAMPSPTALTSVASYIHNLEPTAAMSTVVRLAEHFPRASLHLLDEFYQQGACPQHFVRTGFALVALPRSWVVDHAFTHIDLSNNLLSRLPVELLQLPSLRVLGLARNCLEALPPFLKWNCPALRDIDLSHNRLKDVRFSFLEGRRRREEGSTPAPGAADPQQQSAERLRRLTGLNLYPCIRSLSKVNLSANRSLSQVPEWVCLLPHITLLNLTGMPLLVALSPHLSRCRYLCVLSLDVETLVSPPVGVARRGTRAILAFLRCKLRGSLPYRHVKLVLMGDPGTGKTALFNLLLGQRNGTDPAHPSMDVASFVYRPRQRSTSEDAKITFHVMDFAGCAALRPAHRCFLTYRSVYLVLWNLADGKDGLMTVLPWLRSIQACVPGSPVILIATHFDLRPGVSTSTILGWEEEVLGDLRRRHSRTYAAQFGLPPIERSVVLDSRNRDDVELLREDVYRVTRRLRHPRSQAPVVEEQVPRMYHHLQSLVEAKVKSMGHGGGGVAGGGARPAPVLRHEEFVDYFHSLAQGVHEDSEEDREELTLACRFLHEAGTIVHYKSHLLGVSDLYFLDPQWLFNALTTVISSRLEATPPVALLTSGEVPAVLSAAGVPPHVYSSFLSMLEAFDITVALDMEKGTYLFPSLLPSTPPPHYPHYDLSSTDDKLTQYIQFDYLPNGFFSRLLARVLIYLRQLSGQLMAASPTPSSPAHSMGVGLEEADGGLLSKASITLPNIRFGQGFKVDRHGYVCHDDEDMDLAHDEGTVRRKIRALSCTLSFNPTRHRSLTEKLVSLSQPYLQQSAQTATSTLISLQDPKGSLSHVDPFCSYVFWRDGLFVEFPSGTKFWLEACTSAVVVVVTGALVSRVKVLSFVMSCADVLVTEVYEGLEAGHYSPCPACLRQYWMRRERSPTSALDSSLELTLPGHSVSVGLSGRVTYSPSCPDPAQSFSGSSLKLTPSPPPSEPGGGDGGVAAGASVLLEGEVTLFPLGTAVLHSTRSSAITCGRCGESVPLVSLSPHVLLVDFSDRLLLDPARLRFTETDAAMLGSGGFSKVYRGSYEEEAVAVKLFHRGEAGVAALVQQYKDLRGELTVMSQLHHPRVVALVGVCLQPLCMVLPLAPQASLSTHLDLCPQGFDPNVAHRLLYQIADGLRYLHSLYIVHRDVKPSNVLVWSLHPEKGIDVKLTDYGISQFSSPSGLRRHRGTEEYMAPELFRSRNYDEKVDIYSFALILHLVMTGKRLFASMVQKWSRLRALHRAEVPQLSQSLAEALAENLPRPTSALEDVLECGRHPAARRDVITACHSVCMQQLLEDCLAGNPSERPSAQGLCSRLLVCPGGQPQAHFFITTPLDWAVYCPASDAVLGLRRSAEQLFLLSPGSWQVHTPTTPFQGQRFACCVSAGTEVFLASADSRLIFSLGLPSLTSGHISPEPLPGQPLCLIPHPAAGGGGLRLVVGLAGGRIAVFFPPGDGRHLLETKPFVREVVNNPDASKISISCGVFHRKVVWCGCGRYLIGLDVKDYILRHYKPVLANEGAVKLIAAVMGRVWVSFEGRSDVVVCDTQNGLALDAFKCSSLLNVRPAQHEAAEVTALASSPEAVWVGTRGGHLVAFDPCSATVLLVHQRHTHLSSILPLGASRLITFGRGEGVEGEGAEEELAGMFTVWTSFIHHTHLLQPT